MESILISFWFLLVPKWFRDPVVIWFPLLPPPKGGSREPVTTKRRRLLSGSGSGNRNQKRGRGFPSAGRRTSALPWGVGGATARFPACGREAKR